ncbi:DUF2971 domain-containing protein [Natrinema versiforme]|uniref:DUF2971 domain-containing protein n=1 Tax=Natrinema versiforme TaxID=88724 RepID=A0A4P8WIZ1_9EURY|nr:DUF2971 domain-containing protein [Natrinema versiforme]QCS43419.1 DUF2971 domain-containing protein [Natrinema versiforme]
MPIQESERHWWGGIEQNERAWRYLSFPAFTKLLRTEELFFRKVSKFPDPYEGSIPHSLTEIRKKDARMANIPPERFEKVYSEINDHARKCSYANCWHLNSNESEAMWQKYGDKGIAIISSVDNFIPSFKNQDKLLFARPVRYIDYFKSFETLSGEERTELKGIGSEILDEFAAINFVKRGSFKYEREFRILQPDLSYFPIKEYEDREYNIRIDGEKEKYPAFTQKSGVPVCVDFTKTPEGWKRELEVNLSTLIDEIRVAPGAGEWFYKTVCEVVDEVGSSGISSDLVQPSVADVHDPKR